MNFFQNNNQIIYRDVQYLPSFISIQEDPCCFLLWHQDLCRTFFGTLRWLHWPMVWASIYWHKTLLTHCAVWWYSFERFCDGNVFVLLTELSLSGSTRPWGPIRTLLVSSWALQTRVFLGLVGSPGAQITRWRVTVTGLAGWTRKPGNTRLSWHTGWPSLPITAIPTVSWFSRFTFEM